MLSNNQGDIKYYFLRFWYNKNLDWIPISHWQTKLMYIFIYYLQKSMTYLLDIYICNEIGGENFLKYTTEKKHTLIVD